MAALESLPGVRVLRAQGGGKMLEAMTDLEKAKLAQEHGSLLTQAVTTARRGECDLLLLDEALDALQNALLEPEALAGLLRDRPAGVELLLTGHRPVAWVLDAADYVTEMVKRKHPYDLGIPARKGVEY